MAYEWINPSNVDAALDAIHLVVICDQPGRLNPDQWDIVRWAILHRDKYQCANCGVNDGSKVLDAHHIVPVANGGGNRLDNIKTLCRDCHRLIHSWMQ